jgi:predicted RNA-binding Zn ribbon-like protein
MPGTDGEASGFPFHHGRISLSFAGTVKDRGSEPVDRIGTPAQFAAWLEAANLANDARPTAAAHRTALRLRESIASIARSLVGDAKVAAEDVARVNDVVRRAPWRPELDPRTLALDVGADPVRSALGRIARDAIELFGDAAERERIRSCALDSCASIFLTPAAGRERRWCSMERCGNRAKVAAFRERERTAVRKRSRRKSA